MVQHNSYSIGWDSQPFQRQAGPQQLQQKPPVHRGGNMWMLMGLDTATVLQIVNNNY